MEYKVLNNFKCRFQDFKIFKSGDQYQSADEKHTKKLIDLGFIEQVNKPKKTTKKKDDES